MATFELDGLGRATQMTDPDPAPRRRVAVRAADRVALGKAGKVDREPARSRKL